MDIYIFFFFGGGERGAFFKTFLEGFVDHIIHRDYDYSESALFSLL